MSKVSDGRLIRVGLVGPKPRLRSVGDGQRVKIPVLGDGANWNSWEDGAAEWMAVVSG